MKNIKIILLFVLLFCVAPEIKAQQAREAAIRQIAAVENAFADYAAANGTKAAFLKFAAPDGIVFNPNPANAREVWSKKEARSALLEWRPHWVDASASGDIGLSTGSWEFSPKSGDAPVAWGEFFTIWKRQPNGEWLWVLDVGFDHEKAPVPKNAWKSPTITGELKNNKNASDTWQSLETRLAQAINGKPSQNPAGFVNGYENMFSDQVRLLREKHLPFQGKKAAMNFIRKQNAAIKTKALGGEVAADFAYTYGEYEAILPGGETEKGHFVRTWRRELQGWRITADFVTLIPASK
ncbi:MAG TPA: nuclear transport factor 2 family protein [Pyrinomonadaceae bacterium]|jgi:ketosteroid isomerase-like protein